MNIRQLIPCLILASSALLAEDLPLPAFDSSPATAPSQEMLRPTVIIKPPAIGIVTAPTVKPDDARELALLEMERQIIETTLRMQIAQAHRNGKSMELKQLILMGGPVDAAISRAAKPPVAPEGKLALIGLPQSVVVTRHLDQFFGAPMTPAAEKQLIETVKSQLAGTAEKSNLDVRIAGWWPLEGVLAVSVVPRG
jgi:hypothetical protein